MKLSICWLISSRICTVTFFFESVGPGDLDQLALVQVPGDEEEVSEEEDHGELAEESHEPRAADPDVVGRAEGWLDDLHALRLVPSGCRPAVILADRCDCGCLLELLRGLLDLRQHAARFVAARDDALAQTARRLRNVRDDRHRFIAQRVHADADAGHEQQDCDRRARGARDAKAHEEPDHRV